MALFIFSFQFFSFWQSYILYSPGCLYLVIRCMQPLCLALKLRREKILLTLKCIFIFIVCARLIWLNACMSNTWMLGALQSQLGAWNPRELECQAVVSHHIGAGSQTCSLSKRNDFSLAIGPLFGSYMACWNGSWHIKKTVEF